MISIYGCGRRSQLCIFKTLHCKFENKKFRRHNELKIRKDVQKRNQTSFHVSVALDNSNLHNQKMKGKENWSILNNIIIILTASDKNSLVSAV